MTIEKLNDDLADRLGRNPQREGHYKWMYSEHWMHLMKTGTQEVQHGIIIALEPRFEPRKMLIDVEDTWALAHWHPPCPQFQWECENPRLLWPREGYYAPTNIMCAPGQRPEQSDNDKVVILIKQQAAKSMADLIAEGEALVARKDKRHADYVSDSIDNHVSAFCNIPGTRSAHVSFPLHGSSREKAGLNG